MLIRDLESKSGLERATIRFYEKEGLIIPQRKENGYREYTEDNLSHLLKIKLLRQLGMPLDTIKRIQQGSTDFNHALSIQIRNLEHLMQVTTRAKDVCTELYHANISYEKLDAAYYLQQLTKQQPKAITNSFREYVERPYHPIRRFLARMTDYALLRMILEFFLVVILRVRPYGEFMSGLITYGTPFLMIPIAAFMLNRWGATPGKWLYGLSVYSENGCKLSYADAQTREWRVLAEGYGFGIPGWSAWRLYKSYRAYQEWDTEWDTFCEYQFRNWSNKRRYILAASIAAIVVVNLVTVSDAVRPKYRGDMTVAEFASNYNYYNKLINKDTENQMRSDGSWYPEQDGHVTIYTGAQPETPRQNFVFQTDGVSIRSVHFENAWNDIFLLCPVTYQCKIAAVTAVMSQKGIGIFDILAFLKAFDSADMLNDGEITYQNVKISWDIEAENCSMVTGGYFISADDSKESYVRVEFEIIIQ